MMLTLLVALSLSQEPVRGTDGPVAGTTCSGPDACKVLEGSCSTDGGVSSWPAPKQGPACGCVKGVCQYLWIEPVACTRDAECALSTEPVLHAIKAAPSKKKQRPFRPCKDGERQAVCDEATKTCAVRSWKC
ncbi:MAG: hypothetical protein GQE15_03135 [Archangiaceae bacterium]|nr:hypothetical protein [Archangiaceae bacterium]